MTPPQGHPLPPAEPHPYPSLAITGSRRLTGANLYSQRPGAVLEVTVLPDEALARIQGWRRNLDLLLRGIGWDHQAAVVRYNDGARHAGLFLSAPADGLLAATEVNEQAWLAAEQEWSGTAPDYADTTARLRVFIRHDRRPALMTIMTAATARSLPTTIDDEQLTIGFGAGSRSWPLRALPSMEAIPWESLHGIPVALVTGSNGKTTTTRLLARMLQADGHTVGWSCTDGVSVGDEVIAEGDYSGPAGARQVLHDSRVTAAVLETARGGILRRGLAVDHAQVAIVTNVSDDHLGEFGIDDIESLGEVKLVVTKVVSSSGCVVLNADDPTLRALASTVAAPVTWYSASGQAVPFAGGEGCVMEHDTLVTIRQGTRHPLVAAHEMPLSLGGMMRYNVANAMAASAAALALGISIEHVRHTLRTFGSSPADNRGRLATFSLRGARLLVDFVHNPDGWSALTAGLVGLPGRRIAVVGQAGDRDNRALHELAAAVWRFTPDMIVLKEMPSYLRGRPLGETSDILAREFAALGASPAGMRRVDDELAAIDFAAGLAQEGDLIVLGVHDDFDAAVERLKQHGAVRGPWT